jgi:hypothetical protein
LRLECTKIHSISGLLPADTGLVTTVPFRSPHHSVSDAGLIGGGSIPLRAFTLDAGIRATKGDERRLPGLLLQSRGVPAHNRRATAQPAAAASRNDCG